MKKKTVAIIMLAVIMLTLPLTAEANTLYRMYKAYVQTENIATIREFWSEDLTAETLETRGSDIIIEKNIGTVIDDDLNGRVMGGDPNFSYINYSGVAGAKKGDVILTISIYQPGNTSIDDIAVRFDYIIDTQ